MNEPEASLQHYLRPLVTPRSVALVGASERPGSLGRIVLENLVAGDFHGTVHAVNPAHRTVLGRPCHPRLQAIGASVDLALVAAPSKAIYRIIDDAGAAGVKVVILLGEPPPLEAASRERWLRDLVRRARKRGVRLVGTGAFGIVRTDLGLNASVTDVRIAAGRLALVAQSGAVCAAMLDFAAPLGIGFSTVLSLGAAIDVNFGELLDALLVDVATDGILLYVESMRDARRFLSALRAAARTKPVVVLKSGRWSEPPDERAGAPAPDAVFDAAIRRAGTVRVRSYTQLFAAARILSMGRIPRGDRLAVVANGRGPGVLAADTALERGVRLAHLDAATQRKLDALLPPGTPPGNPVDVHNDAPPERFAAAVEAVLDDAGVDAVVALYVPRPAIGATDAARAVAEVARRSGKPVLGAWLGAIDRREARAALDAGGVPNFYTPENAVEAFSFLAAYRRHQEWLLEVPSPQPEPTPPDLDTAESVRLEAPADRGALLDESAATRLLRAFGIGTLPRASVASADEAKQMARKLGYPVTLALPRPRDGLPASRERLRDARAVARAFDELASLSRGGRRRRSSDRIVVCKEPSDDLLLELAVGVHTDAVFGPVIALGPGRGTAIHAGDAALMLPPLNRRLAGDLVDAIQPRPGSLPPLSGEPREGLVRLLLQISTLVCALPWVVELELDPLLVTSTGVQTSSVRVRVDARRARLAGYAHMAIHPYPSELESDFVARNGTRVHIRPIRPEDALREERFVNGLSEQSRYFRFFYRMQTLTPAMLARFTQVDYDREMALVALGADPDGVEGLSFAGVARYIVNPDGESAEYAIVVGDAWHGQGIGRALMERLIAAARHKGIARFEGPVLRDNAGMLKFVTDLGFTTRDDPDAADQVVTTLELG